MNVLRVFLLLLGAANLCQAYYQFQHTLVPTNEETQSAIVASRRATYGRYSEQDFKKIARTRELHNCVLPGCRLMGEVLNIKRYNVTAYDQESFKKKDLVVTNARGKKSTHRQVPPPLI